MKENEALAELRSEIIRKNITELALTESQESLRDVLDKINVLKEQMNNEKISALEEIEARYLDRIRDLENEYAFLLKLMA